MTKETRQQLELAVDAAISRAEIINLPGVHISAWCDFGGADEASAPIVCLVSLDDSDEFEQFPPKKERVESVVKALWTAGIYAVDSESQLGRYSELFSEEVTEATEQIKICGLINI